MRTGMFTALAIGLHNFPEGLVTFLAALEDVHLGVTLAIAVALHNIPEGISVSVPIYYATGSRRRAFAYSMLSGLAEPVGALVGYALLLTFFTGVMEACSLESEARSLEACQTVCIDNVSAMHTITV